jgi:hypothetical protein
MNVEISVQKLSQNGDRAQIPTGPAERRITMCVGSVNLGTRILQSFQPILSCNSNAQNPRNSSRTGHDDSAFLGIAGKKQGAISRAQNVFIPRKN